jgi:two-component system sensor histidine kinase ChvG
LKAWLSALVGRIWVRLLLINLVVVLVPVFGLEFARIYEKQLLAALERDMSDQAALVCAILENDLVHDVALDDERNRAILEDAARKTRMRVRVLDPRGQLLVDSHDDGAPEGPEPEPPRLFRTPNRVGSYTTQPATSSNGPSDWPPIAERKEVVQALAGTAAWQTRVSRNPKAVYLFSATPVFREAAGTREVAGAVYITRSTNPVLFELYRIRSGLFRVLFITLCISAGTTLLLALSISRPLSLLSRAAKRIARGERSIALPVAGAGEVRELSQSFKTMTEELDRRLVYISEFSADVAHEFKSPLTSIRGAAELLAEGAHADPEVRQRFLANILLDTERLDRLVSRLLVLSRIEASADQMTLVDLHSLLTNLTRRAEQKRPVVLSYLSKHAWVRGREPDLEAAISNLLENAQRYSPPGCPVTIECRDDGNDLCVSVHDEGPGIPDGRRTKIFDRFYTTDGDRGGTGLGLAIVESVARAHGGRVTLDPDAPRGTTFHLWLPAADG